MMQIKIFSVITFGCKLNQAESQNLKEKLIKKGFLVIPENQVTNFFINNKEKKNDPCFIINACAVTAKAEKELRQKINQLKRQYPSSFLIVTGCYLAQKNENVDLWINRKELINKIYAFARRVGYSTTNIQCLEYRRVRTFIKIQDGCDNYCTYCLVPYLRGRPKNRSANAIIKEIKKREKEGCKEVVLVGTDLRKINFKPGRVRRLNVREGKGLVDLIKIILKKTKISIIRISSLWPMAITSDLIKLIKKEPRICPHLHLSLQSGSDKILKRMGRNYQVKKIIELINKLKRIPNLNLTADIIVGFPGETEEDFQETLNLVKKANFLKVHVFRYSPRPKTLAAKMPNQISEKIKKQRSKKLIVLSEKISKKVKNKYLGRIFPVLIENKKDNLWTGFTANYLRIYLKSSKNLA
ncbi:MAG: tRNA (N(6)-L-threonylcarbamoyladenosine(37)-C(2))-methylthiotransferase MtaB, partial [Minisyncoccia bacterium]